MNGQLHPEFIKQLLTLLSNPPAMCDVVANLFYPQLAIDFAHFAKMMIRPDLAIVYNWWQERFPGAPMLDMESNNQDPNEMFRELLKHMIAKAFEMEYKTPSKILISK